MRLTLVVTVQHRSNLEDPAMSRMTQINMLQGLKASNLRHSSDQEIHAHDIQSSARA